MQAFSGLDHRKTLANLRLAVSSPLVQRTTNESYFQGRVPMKAIVCEMCSSNNVIKSDGVFVCQNCGTKYSVEEARKLMVEGTVDVSGSTVKLDNTELISNYLKMAHNAYESNNNKEAETYCNKIIEIDPEFSEAWLLKGIVAGWQSKGGNIRMDEFLTCTEKAFTNASTVEELEGLAVVAKNEFKSLVLAINKMKLDGVVKYPKSAKEYTEIRLSYLVWGMNLFTSYAGSLNKFNENKPDEEKKKPETITLDVTYELKRKCDEELVGACIELWNNSLNEFNNSSNHIGYPTDYALEQMIQDGGVAMSLLESILIPKDTSKVDEKDKPIVIRACKNAIVMRNLWKDMKSYTVSFSGGIETHPVSKSMTLATKQECVTKMRRYHEIIKEFDPSYEVPVVPDVPTPSATSSGGCYVATAVYGSYDCPQVWTLRRYRDYTLAETWYGRAFIHTYYAISPTLVKWFGHTAWFKKMWRGRLDRMVNRLNSEGVENTPYHDRKW